MTSQANAIYQISLVLLVLCRVPLLRVSSFLSPIGQKTISHVWKVVAPTLVTVGPINAQTELSAEIESDQAPGYDDTNSLIPDSLIALAGPA